MRAREFITEEQKLPPEQADPMRQTFILPGLSSDQPYQIYRFGMAMARARSNAVKDDLNPFILPWNKEEVFGNHAVVAGINKNVDPIIDQALQMTDTPGGKKLVGTAQSHEPPGVDTTSPVRAFKGYPR
jgi:hypothetical protein